MEKDYNGFDYLSEDNFTITVINAKQCPIDNKNSLVIVRHDNSNLWEGCNDYSSQHKNKDVCFKKLNERLFKYYYETSEKEK